MSHPPRITLLFFLQLFSLSYATTCYKRDGTVLDADQYRPCSSATAFSSCCLLDQPDGGPSDICTSAGLCLRQDTTPGFLYINGCTDKTWEDPSCPNFCSNFTDTVLQACNDVGTGTWCCRASNASSCCDQAFTTDIGQLIIPSQITQTISATQIVAATPASTACSTAVRVTEKSTASTMCSAATVNNNKSVAVVGGSVGAVMSVALLAALGALFWREKTRPKLDRDNKHIMLGDRGAYQEFNTTNTHGFGLYEAGSREMQAELDGNALSP